MTSVYITVYGKIISWVGKNDNRKSLHRYQNKLYWILIVITMHSAYKIKKEYNYLKSLFNGKYILTYNV